RTEQFLQQQRASREADAKEGFSDNSDIKFKIKQIDILDDEIFADSPQRQASIDRYQGKELGRGEIFNLVKELTDFYIARGYVTTLLGVEAGNIKSGVLQLRVMWGKINDVKVNGQQPTFRENTRLFTAYPFSKDK